MMTIHAKWLAALLAILALAAPASAQPAGTSAVVDARHAGREGARVAGARTYRTIGGALGAAPRTSARYVVFIRDGRYREKLTVERPSVTLVGESRDGTILTFDAASDTRDPAGVPYGTRGSFTLRIVAPDFQADNLTIENGFDYPANAAKAADDPTRFRNTQAVAVMTAGASDRARFTRCRITGYQDTLFPNAGRHYFHGCIISGHVDFIFGAGQAVFDDCDIVSRDRDDAANNGYVAAPSTAMGKPHGFLFIRSRLKKESPAMAPGSVALGRPWHPSADPLVFSRAAFVDVYMDDHIGARGWDRMSSVDSTTTIRYWFEPANAGFFEYGSTGPGAVASPTRRVLTPGEARGYTIPAVLGDWDPKR